MRRAGAGAGAGVCRQQWLPSHLTKSSQGHVPFPSPHVQPGLHLLPHGPFLGSTSVVFKASLRRSTWTRCPTHAWHLLSALPSMHIIVLSAIYGLARSSFQLFQQASCPRAGLPRAPGHLPPYSVTAELGPSPLPGLARSGLPFSRWPVGHRHPLPFPWRGGVHFSDAQPCRAGPALRANRRQCGKQNEPLFLH